MRAKSLLIAVSIGSLVPLACKATIKQDANSGKDYRSKGAKKIKIEDNEGRSKRDVVTYPGGDRVDWKEFEIAKDQPPGELTIRVKHTPPRPGLDVAFDVYDEYFDRVGRAKPKGGKRSKKVVVDNARPGKYYVMVYAPERGDAGKYRVRVRFKPGKVKEEEPEPGPEVYPDPPKLAAVPEPEPEAEKIPCPNDPTKFQPDCPGPKVPCPDDPTKFEPDCPVKVVKPIPCRIVNYKISASGGVVVICDKGTKHGVDKGWKGQLVDRSGNAVGGGVFTVTRVTSNQATGKVRLSVDQVKANSRAILTPNQ